MLFKRESHTKEEVVETINKENTMDKLIKSYFISEKDFNDFNSTLFYLSDIYIKNNNIEIDTNIEEAIDITKKELMDLTKTKEKKIKNIWNYIQATLPFLELNYITSSENNIKENFKIKEINTKTNKKQYIVNIENTLNDILKNINIKKKYKQVLIQASLLKIYLNIKKEVIMIS